MSLPLATLALSWSTGIAAIALLAAGWLLGSYTAGLADTVLSRSALDPIARNLVQRLAIPTIFAIALIAALSVLGLDPGGVLVVLATGGLLCALALRESLTDIASGAQLLSLRPFNSGDHVEIDGLAGRVREQGIFGVTLESPEGELITVWNRHVANAAICNLSRSGLQRLSLSVRLPRSLGVENALKSVHEMVDRTDGVRKEPGPEIRVTGLSNNQIHIELHVWSRLDKTTQTGNTLHQNLSELSSCETSPG